MVRHATRGWLNRSSWVVAGSLALGLALGLAGTARADEVDDLRAELEQLKQQVLYLQNQIPGASAGGAGGGGNLAAQQEVRMEQFQQQLTDLTGQIERVELKVNDLADQFSRMQKDTEYRLGVLEGNGGATGGAMMGAAPTGDPSQADGQQHVTTEPTPPNMHVTTDTVQQPAQGQGAATAAVPPPSGQPGVLGTLSASQAANLPQAPA